MLRAVTLHNTGMGFALKRFYQAIAYKKTGGYKTLFIIFVSGNKPKTSSARIMHCFSKSNDTLTRHP